MIAAAAEVLHHHANQAPEWMVLIVPALLLLAVGLPAAIFWAKERRP